MENYCFMAVICCFLPFIVGGIWFAMHDKEHLQKDQPRIRPFPFFRTAEDFMIKDYSFYGNEVFSDLGNGLLGELQKVNYLDPRKRDADAMDWWFKNATKQLMHDGKCLGYIEHYGHLENTFWKNMKELNINPEEDEKFQCLLISVCNTNWGLKCKNFGNMLFHYASNYSLSPDVERLLMTDARFVDSKRAYESAHEYALRKKVS